MKSGHGSPITASEGPSPIFRRSSITFGTSGGPGKSRPFLITASLAAGASRNFPALLKSASETRITASVKREKAFSSLMDNVFRIKLR
jgi:hypothetical protein